MGVDDVASRLGVESISGLGDHSSCVNTLLVGSWRRRNNWRFLVQRNVGSTSLSRLVIRSEEEVAHESKDGGANNEEHNEPSDDSRSGSLLGNIRIRCPNALISSLVVGDEFIAVGAASADSSAAAVSAVGDALDTLLGG